MPVSFRKAYERSRASKAFAIKCMCAECTGYDRKAVRDCSDEGCPLWPHRPFQKNKGKGDEEEDEILENDMNQGMAEATKVAHRELYGDEANTQQKKKCCDSPQIEKGEDKKQCLNCGKTWRKRK